MLTLAVACATSGELMLEEQHCSKTIEEMTRAGRRPRWAERVNEERVIHHQVVLSIGFSGCQTPWDEAGFQTARNPMIKDNRLSRGFLRFCVGALPREEGFEKNDGGDLVDDLGAGEAGVFVVQA